MNIQHFTFYIQNLRLHTWRTMLMTIMMVIACCSCDFRLKPNDENGTAEPLSVQRFDGLESRYLTTGDYAALQQMNTDYPVQTRTLIEDMLQLGEVNDPKINKRFLNFFQDSLLQLVIADVETQYSNMNDIDRQLRRSFMRLQRMLPELPMPLFYAQIGAFGQSIVVGDSLVGISLDKYLGSNYEAYYHFFDEQQRKTMKRQAIVPDCLLFYLLSKYPMENFESRSQQERDNHMGRIMWIVNQALGNHYFKTLTTQQTDSLMKKHPRWSAGQLLTSGS